MNKVKSKDEIYFEVVARRKRCKLLYKQLKGSMNIQKLFYTIMGPTKEDAQKYDIVNEDL